MTGIHTDIETALYSKLTTTGGTALWSTRVYEGQAPQGTALPYVVFFHVAGGDENISPSRIVDVRYQVDCWAESRADARLGGDYLEAALHNGTLNISGWSQIGCEQTTLRSSVENVQGKQFYRRGADYRIRMSK